MKIEDEDAKILYTTNKRRKGINDVYVVFILFILVCFGNFHIVTDIMVKGGTPLRIVPGITSLISSIIIFKRWKRFHIISKIICSILLFFVFMGFIGFLDWVFSSIFGTECFICKCIRFILCFGDTKAIQSM